MKTYIKIYNHLLFKWIYCLFIVLSAYMFSACHDDDIPTPAKPSVARMTVVVYICAENTLCRYYDADMEEMISAARDIPADCNLVVYVDGTSSPELYTIDAQNGKTVKVEYDECDSSSPDEFREKLKYIITQFPSEHYGLVMWSHGSGWIPSVKSAVRMSPRKTIMVDNNQNSRYSNEGNEMAISDMRKVLEELSIHWDYIFFDACFMQCVEVDYELRHVTDYIIASPAEIPAEGAPYDKMLPYLVYKDASLPVSSQMENIVRTYYDAYRATKGVVISAAKTSEMDSLLSITQRLVPDYYEKAMQLKQDTLQAYGAYIRKSYWKPEYYDMGSVMKAMLTANDFAQWKSQQQKVVPYRGATSYWVSEYNKSLRIADLDNASLMSIFVPNEKYDEHTTYNTDIKNTQWYLDFCKQ